VITHRNYIIIAVAFLVSIGIVMIFSCSVSVSDPSAAMPNLLKRLAFVLVSVAPFLLALKIDYHVYHKVAGVLLVIAIVLLAVILIPGLGSEINGARRWTRLIQTPLGVRIGFQPSDFAKLAIILFTASFLTRPGRDVKSLKETFLPLIGLVGLVCVLILIEPDVGTTLLTGAVVMLIALVAGVRLRYVAALAILVVPILCFHIVRTPYTHKRLAAFLEPDRYKDSLSYQPYQAKLALSAGGLLGVGIGNGRAKLGFVPQARSDFIYAIIGEELGLAGTVLILCLFGFLAYEGMVIARSATDTFGSLVAYGITMSITLQALINMAVVVGMVPAKGIPLPFVSSGGSSLFFTMISAGILANIASRCDEEAAAVVILESNEGSQEQ